MGETIEKESSSSWSCKKEAISMQKDETFSLVAIYGQISRIACPVVTSEICLGKTRGVIWRKNMGQRTQTKGILRIPKSPKRITRTRTPWLYKGKKVYFVR